MLSHIENHKYYLQVFSYKCLYKILRKNKNELKEIDIKNRVCHYFDGKINGTKLKIFQFIKFHIKLKRVQNNCVLGSIQ